MLEFAMSFRTLYFCAFLFLTFSCSSCEKDEPGALPNSGEDGSACLFDDDCESGKCDTTYELGYCTSASCEKGCNGGDAFCLEFLSGKEACLDGCSGAGECREGYDCIPVHGEKSACLPKKHSGPTSGQLGSACDTFSCSQELDCLTVNEKGYCVGDCADCDEGLCQTFDGKDHCLASCDSSQDCQLQDRCVDGACLPHVDKDIISFSKIESALGVSCDADKVGDFTYEFRFKLKPDTVSFSVTSFASDGNFKIVEIEKEGQPFQVATSYRHHSQRLLGIDEFPLQFGTYGNTAFDWTIVVPYAPQFSNFLDTDAEYVLRIESHVQAPCFYLLESSGGSNLAIDLYFATDLFNEIEAESNTDLQEILSVLKNLYSKIGVDISVVRYHDLSKRHKERFAKIATSDIRALTSLGRSRSDTLEGLLSIDVFMVDDILSSASGVSPSLPGPPGLHGNPNNGLVFRVVDAGFDNEVIGYIMAHEIGHYLGLRHTSEILFGDSRTFIDERVGVDDPILDTPFCPDSGDDCNKTNLMFPSIPDIGDRVGEISAGQAKALRANPLIRK